MRRPVRRPSRVRAGLLLTLLVACERPPAMESDPETLWFRSRAVVSPADAEWVVAQARSGPRRPWAGPVWVLTPHAFRGRHIVGHQRLFLRDYETSAGQFRSVDAEDNRAMACRELRTTLSALERWSRERKLEWDLQLGKLRESGAIERAICAGASAATAEIERRYPDRPR
jgi:hypothetical protein